MTAPKPDLSEKDFISEEGVKKNPLPLWVWFFLLIALLALVWGGSNWYGGQITQLFKESPFLRVSNREISLFLWQNPEFMRVNAKEKNGYLPAYQYLDKITIDLPKTEQYVIAPPELLFRYHTWKRLVSQEWTPREIPKKEFENFLSYVEEWHPANWPNAPEEYVEMIKQLPKSSLNDLASLSKKALPIPVRMAFQGWKNFFIEGEAINSYQPTIVIVKSFLVKNPHYARNYWRNIVEKQTPNYLMSISKNTTEDTLMPKEEVSAFLRVALFNFYMADKEKANLGQGQE